MDALTARQRWILRPLAEVGLADDEVATLLFRLAFAGAVDPAGPPQGALAPAADQPPPVRRAWLEVLDRLTAGPGGHPGPAETPASRNEADRQRSFPPSAPG